MTNQKKEQPTNTDTGQVREKQLAVRVTLDEFQTFKNKAKVEGKTPSQVLLEFVLTYIDQPLTESSVEARVKSLEDKIQEIEQIMGKLAA